jgi:hypothetical protein
MNMDLTDQDRADLARFLRDIKADRWPFSPKVRRLRELLAKIDPSPELRVAADAAARTRVSWCGFADAG